MTTLKASATRIPPDAFNRVAYQGERIRIERRGARPVYMISEEDLEILESMEDRRDLAAIRRRAKEPTVSLADLKKDLGL